MKKEAAVPSDLLQRKKSDNVATDLVEAAEPIKSGIPANISIIIRLILFCMVINSDSIDIKNTCVIYSK